MFATWKAMEAAAAAAAASVRRHYRRRRSFDLGSPEHNKQNFLNLNFKNTDNS